MPKKLTIPDLPIDDHTVVGDAGDLYDCPDTASVEKHITELTAKIRVTNPQFERLIDLYLRDRDTLLELRGVMSDA